MAVAPETLYTVEEAAVRLKMGLKAIYAEVGTSRLTGRRVGKGRRRILITEADCLEYLERCRSDRSAPPSREPIRPSAPPKSRVPKDYFSGPPRHRA